jgi:hypothetical protein
MWPPTRPQHAFFRHHQGIYIAMPAITAPEPELDQRHVTVARIDEGLQVRVGGSQAGAARQAQIDVARPQRGPGSREASHGFYLKEGEVKPAGMAAP